MFKALDAAADIRDLRARRGRPSIAERRRIKRVRRLAAKALPAPLTSVASLGMSIAVDPGNRWHRTSWADINADGKRTKRRRKVDDAVGPCIIENLMPDLQYLLVVQRPLGEELDELKFRRYDVFDDKLPLLRLVDDKFPGRSSYAGHLLEISRNVSGLMQRLQEHCRAERDAVLTAARVATVVNVVVEESTIEIQNYRHENADLPPCESVEEEYRLQQLQDQLRLFVNGLAQKKLAALSRRMARARKLELAFARPADSPPPPGS